MIAMMKRVKSAKLAEIMKATGWQAHTVRGFVSILVSKEGEKIDSSKERRWRTDVQDQEIASGNSSSNRRLGHVPGAAFLLSGASE